MAKRSGRITKLDEADIVEPVTTVESVGLAPRLSFTLTDESRPRVAWDRLRDKTRDQLRIIASDPEFTKRLGLEAPSVSPFASPAKMDPHVIGMLYGALGSLLVATAGRMGYPADQALTMQFSSNERAALYDPTSKVLAKYTSALGRWEDEILLTIAIGSVIAAKAAGLKKPATMLSMVPDRPVSADSTPETH